MVSIYISADRVFDGTEILTDAGVVIENGRICQVGVVENLDVPDKVPTVEASGKTLLPGLVDAHVHLTYTETTLRDRLEFTNPRNSAEYNAIEATGIAEAHIEKGITSLRDIGSRGGLAVAIRDTIEDDLVTGPRVRASGPILTATGGLADLYPDWIDAATPLVRKISGPGDAIEAVREQAKAGVDNVKIEASGEWINPYSDSQTPTASEAELTAAVDAAHSRGLTAAAHAKARGAIETALNAGIDTIEHGTFVDGELIDRMREDEVPLVTTITCYENVLENGLEAYPPERVEVLREEIDRHYDAIRRAHEAGVPVAVGTDTGPPFSSHGHGAAADEIVHLVESCGFVPIEALQAATRTAAMAAGFDDVGVIEPGARGDVIVVNGDPSQDPSVLQHHDQITHVVKGGELLKGTA